MSEELSAEQLFEHMMSGAAGPEAEAPPPESEPQTFKPAHQLLAEKLFERGISGEKNMMPLSPDSLRELLPQIQLPSAYLNEEGLGLDYVNLVFLLSHCDTVCNMVGRDRVQQLWVLLDSMNADITRLTTPNPKVLHMSRYMI